MKSAIKKSQLSLIKSFDDSSLVNFGGNLSVQRTEEIEKLILPQLSIELEKLREFKNRIYKK